MIFVPTNKKNYVVSTSYLTVEDANEIITAQRDSDSWGSLSSDMKKIILNQSSLAVDGAFNYQGKKTNANQILKFPRGGAKDIPAGLRYAVAILCLKCSNDEAFKGITSEKVGKISVSFDKIEQGITHNVLAFLSPLKTKSIKINQ